ncbi:MAG: hypothetical protein V3W04_01875 [Gammaproteobacteria bacterium]
MKTRHNRNHRSIFFLMLLTGCVRLSASPVISEVFYDAQGGDNGYTFIELYGSPGDILDGYRLEAINGTNGSTYLQIALTGIIPDDGIFVVADKIGDITYISVADLLATANLQNGPDSLILTTDAGIIDALAYGDFSSSQFSAGEGQPAPGTGPGSSLARRTPWFDTDENAIDFSIFSTPTPGSIPSTPVPVPSSIALLFSGFLALAGYIRRYSGQR